MKKQLMLACLAFCLAFSSHSMAAEKNGWRSEAGGSVYYVKGTKALIPIILKKRMGLF